MQLFKTTFVGRNLIRESITNPNNKAYDPLGVDCQSCKEQVVNAPKKIEIIL